MQGWTIDATGEPSSVMALGDLPEPSPGEGQVAIDVGACALSFPDLLFVRGAHQEATPTPATPGVELAGRVRAVGPGVDALAPGDRVVGLAAMPHGGLAEVALSDATAVHPIPDAIGDVQAAAMYTAFQTAWFGLHERAGLRAGEWLLVHAGAGGVGSAAIQLGVAAGARVIASAGSPEKLEICRRLGAEHVVDYTAEPDFAPRVNEITGGRGVDVVYDPVGGDVFDRSRRCIAWAGRLVVIGFASTTIPTVKVNHLLIKNYSVLGLYWGPYATRDPGLVRRAHDEIVDLVVAGTVDPLVMGTYPLEQAAQVLESLGTRGTYGRPVVVPGLSASEEVQA
jgi:NADPH2:quinone reductase